MTAAALYAQPFLPQPSEPIPKSGIGMLAHMIVSKLVDHLPLHSQETVLEVRRPLRGEAGRIEDRRVAAGGVAEVQGGPGPHRRHRRLETRRSPAALPP